MTVAVTVAVAVTLTVTERERGTRPPPTPVVRPHTPSARPPGTSRSADTSQPPRLTLATQWISLEIKFSVAYTG